MLRKPDACKGCPYYGNGLGFVPDVTQDGAPLLVYGQNPGEEEEKAGTPFVGKTGEAMDKDYLPLTTFNRGEVSVGNALRCRVNGTNELPPLNDTGVRNAIVHCTRAHFRLPEGVRLIVAQGAYALWALTGEGLGKGRTVNSWRGYLLPYNPPPLPAQLASDIWTPGPHELPVLVSLHLAAVFRDPAMKVPARRDWSKVPLILTRKWPVPLVPISTDPLESLKGTWGFDTEYDPQTSYLLRYSVSDSRTIRVVEREHMRTIHCQPGVRLVMHNAPADLPHADELFEGPYDLEDTMYEHAVLWPGATDEDEDESGGGIRHTLDFLGSMYARTNRWKHLAQINPLVYSAGDALGTIDAHTSMAREFQRDERSWWVYRNVVLPQARVIARAQRYGLRLDQQKVREFYDDLAARAHEAELKAQAAVGWPINLNSNPQLTHQLYQLEQIHRQRSFPRRPLVRRSR